MNFPEQNEKGFTLLLAALVASITLALGAAIYSITIKQVTLSGIGRDSQYAFYAADTLAECALYSDIHESAFSTTTPPASIKCNGEDMAVTALANSGGSSSGSASYASVGSYSFTVPPTFGSLTVNIYGAGGGGGGGGGALNGCNGGQTSGGNGSGSCSGTANGTDTSFNGVLVANPGGPGTGGRLSNSPNPAASGSGGGGSGGTVTSGGGNGGGPGGPGTPLGTRNGGAGGNGGLVTRTYTSSELLPNSSVAVIVGAGGSGGNPGSVGAGAGTAGNPGRVDITWTGLTAAWSDTTFSFHMDLNNDCADGTLVKSLVSGAVKTVIHVEGSNASCLSKGVDPRALARSVELSY